ncbi:MAG: histidine--tRNA ligase [Dehalococcoidia bacterium]|nr:histidine--tRNA ligase [Dehalococcoidia bacterium]
MFKAPRGTRDILPPEQGYWKWVTEKAAEMCRLYGYQRIDTPVFEDAGLFVHSVGEETDIVEKQMYTFEDRGGDKITLRPEGTAPVCRAYIEHGLHNLPQPVRLFYFGPIFRYERPQAGRFRQHQQFGCEAIGAADATLDAEIIDMAWNLYASLGLKNLTLQLNSIGCRTCRREYLQRLKDYYVSHEGSLCRDCRNRLSRNPLRLLDCKNPNCQDLMKGAPRITEYICADCHSHFTLLQDCLVTLQIPYEVNPYLVRGLDYYTRTVFEIQPVDVGGQSTIGGGGRYDNLIEMLDGKPTPAVGFATGLERIILNLQKQGIELPTVAGGRVYVAYLGEEARKEAVRLGARLRRAGIAATLAMDTRSLKAQLKQANALGFSHAVIIGEEELKANSVLLRDMANGSQVQLSAEEAIRRLKP